jgi:hypothetical protein
VAKNQSFLQVAWTNRLVSIQKCNHLNHRENLTDKGLGDPSGVFHARGRQSSPTEAWKGSKSGRNPWKHYLRRRWITGSAKAGGPRLESAALSAQGRGPQPSITRARDEARTWLPAHALIKLVLQFGMDRIEFDRLVEHLSFAVTRGRERSAAVRTARRYG